MKRLNKKFNVLVTGLLTLILFSLALFWGRHLCQLVLTSAYFSGPARQDIMEVKVTKFIPEFDERLKGFPIKVRLGEGVFFNQYLNYIYDSYFHDFMVKNVRMDDLIALDSVMSKAVYYDRKTGRLVLARFQRDISDRAVKWSAKPIAFAGPKGVSSSDSSSLGRFGESPLISRLGSTQEVFFFDRNARRYYLVDFDHKTVKESSEFAKTDPYGYPLVVGFHRDWGVRMDSRSYAEIPEDLRKRLIEYYPGKDNNLVLDRSGTIGRFDLNTMSFVSHQAGSLGDAPSNSFAYTFVPYSMDNKYMGAAVMRLNRTLRWMDLRVFSEKGNLIKYEYRKLNPWIWEGGVTFSMINWFLENLHPPILDVATYFTADKISALEGQKSIFLLSESLLGQTSREMRDKYLWERIFVAFIIMSPSIVLICILIFQVNREAKFLGLLPESRRAWKYGILLFGLPAYITWRIVRPKEVMVTCKNCGKLRRPEFENCQHCKSLWHVPEITPPSWRVVESSEACDLPAEAMVKQA
jgi:hypothetical protein